MTERPLIAVGVTDEFGSVEHGRTQTDTLALERQHKVTIKPAAVWFVGDGVSVPG